MLNFSRKVSHFSHVFLDKDLSSDIWVTGDIEESNGSINIEIDSVFARISKDSPWLNLTSTIIENENYCDKLYDKITEWYSNECLGIVDDKTRC
jgi:hypothetical protein